MEFPPNSCIVSTAGIGWQRIFIEMPLYLISIELNYAFSSGRQHGNPSIKPIQLYTSILTGHLMVWLNGTSVFVRNVWRTAAASATSGLARGFWVSLVSVVDSSPALSQCRDTVPRTHRMGKVANVGNDYSTGYIDPISRQQVAHFPQQTNYVKHADINSNNSCNIVIYAKISR